MSTVKTNNLRENICSTASDDLTRQRFATAGSFESSCLEVCYTIGGMIYVLLHVVLG